MAVAIKKVSRQKIFKNTIGVFFLIGLLAIIAPFFRPILLAAVFAFAVDPFVSKVTKTSSFIARPRCAAGIVISALLVMGGILSFIGLYFYMAIKDFAQMGLKNNQFFQSFIKSKNMALNSVDQILRKFDLGVSQNAHEFVNKSLTDIENWLGQSISAFLSSIPETLLTFFTFCLTLYLFISQGRKIKLKLLSYKLIGKKDLEVLLHSLQVSSYSAVVTSFITGLLQSSVVTLGSYIFGFQEPLIIFCVVLLLSFIPVVGAGPVPTAFAIYCFLQGETQNALGLLVVALIAGTIDNIVRPMLVSKNENGLHPVISFLAIIGGLSIFGVAGLFIGPVIASVTVSTLPPLFFGVISQEKNTPKERLEQEEEKMRLLKITFPPPADSEGELQEKKTGSSRGH